MGFKLLFLIFFYNFLNIYGFNLCVVGGSSGLGREIIYQAIEKDLKILTLTNNPDNIKLPYRGGGLNNKKTNLLLRSCNLKITNYNNFNNYNFSNIVFTTGAKPWKHDYSDIITKNILSCESFNFDNIVLLSAYGVGDSLTDSNLGIKIMNNLYLQDVYRAKNEQEKMLENYKIQNPKTNVNILRPKALSYGNSIFIGRSRQSLASEIIRFLNF